MQPISIHFAVKKWTYNSKAPLTKTHTDCLFKAHPLRSNASNKAEGLGFVWTLVLTGEGIEILYYSSEEFVIIPDKNISDKDLLQLIEDSYHKSYGELAKRNLSVGLDAGFPEFDKIPKGEIKEIKAVLDM